MTTLREAAQQALETLDCPGKAKTADEQAAITSLRAALAEPDVPETDFGNMAVAVAEPVASVTECEACFTPDVCQLRGTCDHYAAERLRVAAPPQRKPLAEPVQGPVAWTDADADAARLAMELEALLLDTKDTAAVSRWWDSAHDALELHRERLRAAQAQQAPLAVTQASNMQAYWGERCEEFNAGCSACQAWRLFDTYKTPPNDEDVFALTQQASIISSEIKEDK